MRHLRLLLVAAILTLAATGLLAATGSPATSGVAVAQETKDYYWDFINVDIAVNSDGSFTVAETQRYVFTQGTFQHGYRAIPLDKVDSITDVSVWEGNTPYKAVRSQAEGGYTTSETDGNLAIDWWFSPTSRTARTFVLKYTVRGGLRIYSGGDQLCWKAVFADRAKAVRSSTVSIKLPSGLDPAQFVTASYSTQATARVVDAQNVIFTSGTVNANTELEIRLQFQHGVIKTSPPAWQAAADAAAAREEQLKPWKDFFNVIGALLAILIPLISALGLYVIWYMRGRDKTVGLVADYLAQPPSNLPAGVVGTLIDERADMKDIIASLVDLARRGVLKITDSTGKGFFGASHTFTFTWLGPGSQKLRPYENTLLGGIFGGLSQVSLDDLKEKFYTVIPGLKDQMYDEVVTEGFFHDSPQKTRRKYVVIGVILLVLVGMLSFFVLLPFLTDWMPSAVCLSGSLFLVPILVMIFGSQMPAKTDKGSLEAAKWIAFKKYLANIEQYTNLQEAKDLFDKYMPYAVAFGLEHTWVEKFSAVGTPAPGWYQMYPPIIIGHGYGGGHLGGGLSAGGLGGGSTIAPGDGLGGSTPSLQGMSDGGLGGLQSMSDGLFSMLNSAGSVLSSSPSSSGGGAN